MRVFVLHGKKVWTMAGFGGRGGVARGWRKPCSDDWPSSSFLQWKSEEEEKCEN